MRVRVSFPLKTLIGVCEMCCSGVKCSTVPSRMRTATHFYLVRERGKLGEGIIKKEGRKEGEMVTDAFAHLLENGYSKLCRARIKLMFILYFLIHCPLSHTL